MKQNKWSASISMIDLSFKSFFKQKGRTFPADGKLNIFGVLDYLVEQELLFKIVNFSLFIKNNKIIEKIIRRWIDSRSPDHIVHLLCVTFLTGRGGLHTAWLQSCFHTTLICLREYFGSSFPPLHYVTCQYKKYKSCVHECFVCVFVDWTLNQDYWTPWTLSLSDNGLSAAQIKMRWIPHTPPAR